VVAPVLEAVFRPQITALPASAKKPQLTITVDKNTNALIIMASPEMYTEMEKLIRDLDIRKAQVLIEAAIVELSMDKMVQLGIELADVTTPKANPTGFGGTSFGLSSQTTDATTGTIGRTPAQTTGLTVGIWKQTVGNIPALLQASQTDAGIDVKAAPRLLTNDNAQASIDISEEIPTESSIIGPDGRVTQTTAGPSLTTGVTLNITPHISEHNYLRLELEQTVGEFVANAYSQTLPAKTTRKAKTVVTVPDRETVIIGGLTKDRKTTTVSKVPLLGDIPIIGLLFQSKKDQITKDNLCIFITPHIIKQFSELTEETEKYRQTVEPKK
jgi:general secretion pathway protein D